MTSVCETDDRPGVSLSQLFSVAGGASIDWVLKHCAVSDVRSFSLDYDI